jgi:hypothetical protein
MLMYVFISVANPRILGLTPDETGENLPDGYGRWQRLSSGAAMPLSSFSEIIAVEVRTYGYFLSAAAAQRVH